MRLHSRAISVLLAVIVSVSTADATITFNVTTLDVSVDTNDGPQTIVLADVNRDTRPDILAVNDTTDGFDVFLNDRSGGFPSTPSNSISVGETLKAIASGDFNHDGNPDVVLVDNSADTAIFLFGDGTGNFSNEQDVPVSPSPVAVVVADLDGDGIDDAAVLSDTSIYLIHSKGDGTFAPFSQPTVGTRSSGGFTIASGLFDNNTFVDLVVTNDAANVSVLLGNGDGTFKAARTYNVGAAPQGIVVAKLNADATQDLAVVDSGESTDLNVSLLYGNSDGTFQSDLRTNAEPLSIAIAAADFDQDGNVDLAVTNTSGSTGVAVLPNDPGCTGCTTPNCCMNGFEVADIQGFGDAEAIQTADLNGDGKPDLVAQGTNGTLGVFLNTTGNPTNTPSTPSTTNTPTVVGDTPTPTPPPTATRPPTLTSTPTATPTVTATFTVTFTLTPTPIPIPYGVCNTPVGPVGAQPVALATGDFNQDGNTDIAVADNHNGLITLLLSHISSGATPCDVLGLTHDSANDITGITSPVALAAQDLDGDGKLDLAVVGSAGLSVFFGNGQGGFTPGSQNSMSAGTSPQGIAIADFNRDGIPDIIVGDEMNPNVYIFLGTGQRQFAAPCKITVGGFATGVVAADLNLDGRADFAVFSDQTNQIYVLLQIVSGSGTPTPTPANMCPPAGTSGFRPLTPLDLPLNSIPRALLVNRFDLKDTTPDFALALSSGAGTDGQGQVLLGAAAGAGVIYTPETPFGVPGISKSSEPCAIGTGDINRDGRLDLVIADKNNDDVRVFLAQSDGSYSLVPDPIPVGKGPVAVALDYIDDDAKPDTVVANKDDGTISILLSSEAPATPTPVPTFTSTYTLTPTDTPTPTPTLTPTDTPTATPTPTPTNTPTATPTPTPTNTPTSTRTGVPTFTGTPVAPATYKAGTVSLSGGGCAIGNAQGGGRSCTSLAVMALALVGWLGRRFTHGCPGR